MKCLVCDNTIRIDTLKQLFAPSPLLLCGRCEQNLIPKQGDVLFEDNEWIRQVIEKLNQGDVILINLFKNNLKAMLQKKKGMISNITIIEHADELPYPWLEILVNEVLDASSGQFNTSTERLVVSVVAHENIPNQISIIA
jgi:hypothetical protein